MEVEASRENEIKSERRNTFVKCLAEEFILMQPSYPSAAAWRMNASLATEHFTYGEEGEWRPRQGSVFQLFISAQSQLMLELLSFRYYLVHSLTQWSMEKVAGQSKQAKSPFYGAKPFFPFRFVRSNPAGFTC
jgi:hypothetical protein